MDAVRSITIVVPVYNDKRVARALDSILAQREAPPVEIVVIDGGSTDGTLDILEAYRPRLAKVVSERDRGVYDAMNKGISIATGDVVGILNSDDRYADDLVLRDVASALKDAEAAYGDIVYVRRDGTSLRYWRSGKPTRAKFRIGWMPPHPSFFVRRDVYGRFGAFDLSFRIAADYELTLRFLHRHQVSSAYVPRVLVRMDHGGMSNRPSNIVRANLEARRAWKRNDLRGGLLVPLVKPLSKLGQFFHRPS